jgi:hypothetical protein
MTNVYDFLADTCAALAQRTKRQADKVRLQQLVEQWRSVGADQHGEAVRRTFSQLQPAASVAVTAAKTFKRKGGRPRKKR